MFKKVKKSIIILSPTENNAIKQYTLFYENTDLFRMKYIFVRTWFIRTSIRFDLKLRTYRKNIARLRKEK